MGGGLLITVQVYTDTLKIKRNNNTRMTFIQQERVPGKLLVPLNIWSMVSSSIIGSAHSGVSSGLLQDPSPWMLVLKYVEN